MIPDILAHHLILSQVLSPQPREGDILPQNPLLARLILRISFSYLSLLHIGQGHLLTSSHIFSPTSYCDGIPIPVLHLLLQCLWVKWKRNAGAALLLFFFFLFFFCVSELVPLCYQDFPLISLGTSISSTLVSHMVLHILVVCITEDRIK